METVQRNAFENGSMMNASDVCKAIDGRGAFISVSSNIKLWKEKIKLKAKSVLSYVTAAGMTAAMFGGMQLSVSAAADQVTFWDAGAESATVLNSRWTSYDADGDDVMDVVFDDESDTVTFSSDITLRSNGVGDTYYTCISSSGADPASKSMTINIPEGVTVTMDNTEEANGWSTALNGTSTGDLTITGGGKLIVKGGGGTAAGSEGFGITPYGKSITIDGVEVTADGVVYGVGYYSGGSLTIQNGGSLEATGGTAAFESGSMVNAEGAVVTGGADADSASAINEDQIALYKYVKIVTEGPDVPVQPSEEPSEEPTLTPTGIRIGEDMIYEEEPTWENSSGVRAVYDKESDTLTLSGTGSVTGPGYEDNVGYGAAIYATGPLNIVAAKDANITLNAGPGSGGWACGIYTYADNADITIGGEGKLTVNSMSVADHAVAICPYGGKADNGYDLTLKGSVDVTANGSAYGVYAWQGQPGWIRITESASLTASGGTKAVYVNDFKDSYIYGGNRDFIGSIDGGEWDSNKVVDAKTISVSPALFSQWTSSAVTGNDQSTGFVTVITGTEGTTIKNIRWRITSQTNDGEIQELSPDQQPQITLGDNAQAVFAVIVENLKDENATAYAIAE